MSINGPPLVCTNGLYTLMNALKLNNSYPQVTWSVNPSNFVSPSSGSGGINANISKSGVGNSTITFNPGCGLTTVSQPIHTGPYGSSDYPITGPSSASCKQWVYYSIPNLSGVTSINWTWPTGWTYESGQNTAYLSLKTGVSSGSVMVGVNNTCGQSGSYAIKFTSVTGYCGNSLYVSPNPASNIINVTITNEEVSTVDSTGIISSIPISSISTNENTIAFKVTIMDNMGVVYYSVTEYSKSFTLPIQNLRNGNYIITVNDGVNIYTSPLVVMH